jgi:hypothetical protein
MVQQMIEGCFDPTRWQVALHGGATWQEVGFSTASLQGPRSFPLATLP